MSTKTKQVPSVEALKKTDAKQLVINYDKWEPTIDDYLFEKRCDSGRRILNPGTSILAYENDNPDVVSAQKTAKKVQALLDSLGISIEDCRWHARPELKKALGGSEPFKYLITYVVEQLRNAK